ncbi:MJ0042-type zinc finger domain-containing protein [Adhaeretor mobilis]|uniref:Uncharacterized protein n=1 Tax=Adhaeretor mobilis TaxID=1930276 RepID=A0A517N0E8_9BACT|nr:MJ0042-type zinc finger domain-containing protein [Adhaeretor mobilis]QDT00508.1 hypothetical protein HG15A2_38460 [Adhaeretor mobilis]
MSIEFPCPKCQETYRVKDDLAGKFVKCAKCNHRILVPESVLVEEHDIENDIGDWLGDRDSQSAATAPASEDSSPPESGRRKCYGCGGSLAEDAVICVACGYDFRSGAKHATKLGDTMPVKTARLSIVQNTRHPLSEKEDQVLTAWAYSLCPEVEAYLNDYASNIDISGLVISIDHFCCAMSGLLSETFSREFEISISGRIAGQENKVKLKCANNISPLNKHQRRTGESRDEDMQRIRDVVKGKLDKKALTHGTISRDPFFIEVSLALLEKFDELLGRDQVPVAKFWRIARVIGVLTSIACSAAAALLPREEPWNTRFVSGLIVLAVAYLVTYAIGACFMPASFFEDFGAGRRIMRFAGTGTGEETQVKLRLTTICAIVGLGFMAYITMTTFASH